MTLGLVFLGPVLAVATFLALGPFNQGAASPCLRLILLADLVYVLVVAALVLARVMRMIADRRSAIGRVAAAPAADRGLCAASRWCRRFWSRSLRC